MRAPPPRRPGRLPDRPHRPGRGGHPAHLSVQVGRSDGVGPISFDIRADGETVEQITVPDGVSGPPPTDVGIPCGRLVEVYADGVLVRAVVAGKHDGIRVRSAMAAAS